MKSPRWLPLLAPLGIFTTVSLVSGSALAVVCNVPSMAHGTIQSAANDMTCTEIVIAAGTYTEQVTVGRVGSIYVHGAGAGRTIIRAPAVRAQSTLATTFHPNYTYVIQVPNGTAADFADLTVDGGSNLPCGEDFYGIRFNNSIGSLDAVVVQGARCPVGAGFGRQAGVGVAVIGDAGSTASLSVLRSTVRDFQKVGILYNGPTASGIVENTVIKGVGTQAFIAQNGVQISRGAAASIARAIISDIHYTGETCLGTDTQVGSGIIVFQAGQSLLYQNVIIETDRAIFLRENSVDQTVFQNRIINNHSGIVSQLNGAGRISLSDNRVTGSTISPAVNAATCFNDSGNSFTLISETGSILELNAAGDSARSGFDLRSTTGNLVVKQNRSTRGARFDLENAGAGNTFSDNMCRTSQPAGLCAFAP